MDRRHSLSAACGEIVLKMAEGRSSFFRFMDLIALEGCSKLAWLWLSWAGSLGLAWRQFRQGLRLLALGHRFGQRAQREYLL